jgi:hypothetical protein
VLTIDLPEPGLIALVLPRLLHTYSAPVVDEVCLIPILLLRAVPNSHACLIKPALCNLPTWLQPGMSMS